MFFSDPLLYAMCMVETGAALFLLVYFIITLSDLECDYLNAQQCCSTLNMYVVPKMVAHLTMTALLILHWHWVLFLTALPTAVWIVYEYIKVPAGNPGVFDPTEIHNRGQLKRHMRDSLIHLGYNLLAFFMYLYCMIIALLKDNPIKQRDDEISSEF
ncbi:Protein cornichon-like protein 4 [Frankliniella fusca]|uniref:Protein cornichon-like protein 4 n=1 Tax=Frankliniella fusca TaxID=407009 RepID=A0AAE1LK38_9NEOP|nr:Protein cornichon-like protein 4 [Frankliniella fusca]